MSPVTRFMAEAAFESAFSFISSDARLSVMVADFRRSTSWASAVKSSGSVASPVTTTSSAKRSMVSATSTRVVVPAGTSTVTMTSSYPAKLTRISWRPAGRDSENAPSSSE